MGRKTGKPALRALLDNLDQSDAAVAALLRWVEAAEQACKSQETPDATGLHHLRAQACVAHAATIDGLIAKILLSHDVFGTQVHDGEYWDPYDYRFEVAPGGEDEDLVTSMLDALMLIRAHDGRSVSRV